MSTTGKCPHCNGVLDPKPKRKRKCPHCRETIIIRKGELYTEQGAQEYDAKQKEEREIKYWANRLRISRGQLERQRASLAKEWGSQPSVNDAVWRILNERVVKVRDLQDRKILYLEMSMVARDEGKDPQPYLAESAKCELLDMKESSWIKKVQVETCNDDEVCPACKKLAAKPIPIDKALAELPIPKLCQNEEGCRCWYNGIVDTDAAVW